MVTSEEGEIQTLFFLIGEEGEIQTLFLLIKETSQYQRATSFLANISSLSRNRLFGSPSPFRKGYRNSL